MARIDEMIAEMPDYLTGEEKMAIARNNLEMEKALKIKKGKPMDVDKADKQNANPKHVEEYILDSKGIYRDKGETDTGRTAITIKNGILHTVSTARLAHRHTLYDYVDGILPPKAMSQGLNLNI